MKRTDKTVVNDVTTKKKYVSPEIEVVNLDGQPRLLSSSVNAGPYGAGFQGIDDDEL